MSGAESRGIEDRPAVRLRRLIPALGIAQIISWGTLVYAIAVLSEAMRAELNISASWLFGAFTFGLLLSGAASPVAGRLVDARGGRLVLSCGSLLGAASLATVASAESTVLLFIGWGLVGIAMAACLYDPAFATLHQLTGTAYRRAVTALTLFGGFASTVFWPASQWLLDAFGWRATLWIYAGLHLIVCLPLHLAFVPGRRVATASVHEHGHAMQAAATASSEAARGSSRGAFVWLATALSIAAFLAAALAAHLIVVLKAAGLTAREAVLVSSLIGPMQVAGRIAEFGFARRLSPLQVGALAFVLMAAGMAALALINGFSPMAFVFAILYGWSNGVMTIVRGTVPAALFGRRNYGALLGRLAQPAFVARAFAPVAFTLMLAAGLPRGAALWTLFAGAAFALVGYRQATRAAGQRRL